LHFKSTQTRGVVGWYLDQLFLYATEVWHYGWL